jgi:hypothetical protein
MLGHFYVLLIGAVLVLTSAVTAQQSLPSHALVGRVTDSAGQHLPGVTVELTRPAESNSLRTVVTGRDGRYRIDKVLPGLYVLAFRLPGFRSAIRDIEIGGGGPEFEYDVQLTPSAAGNLTVPDGTGPSRKVICGMTMVTPPLGIDPGIHAPKPQPPVGQQVKPTIRTVQPTMCREPATEVGPVPPRR